MSNAPVNHRIVLAERPSGAAALDNFRLERAPVPPLQPGQILLRTLWLSLDPYMRGRMSDAPSYAAPVAIGGVMTGGTVSRVEASRSPNFKIGEMVLAMGGWQEYAVADEQGLVKLPASMPHPSFALGVLGMPGFHRLYGIVGYRQAAGR